MRTTTIKDMINRRTLLILLAFLGGTLLSSAQEISIKGLVLAMKNGKPLSEVTVQALNTAVEPVLTDTAGNFQLTVPHGNVMLEFSYPGLKTTTFFVEKKLDIEVRMRQSQAYWYEDYINAPLNQMSNKYFSGAKSHLNSESLDQLHTASIESRLEGQAAGVRVTRYSGAPGAGSAVVIRGVSTINGGTQPLYVMDGLILDAYQLGTPLAQGAVHSPLADINPEDIKSITVLKDGASTSFYGVRGANGVVLIETNKGTSGETKLSFDAYWGLSQINRTYDMMSKSQYKTYYKDLRYKGGLSITDFADQYGEYFYEDMDGINYHRYKNDTDWQDEVLGLGSTQSYRLNLQGGDQVTTYAFSTGYYNQTGTVSETSFSRFSIDFNLLYRVSSKVRFGNIVNFSFATKNLMDQGINPYSNPLFVGLVKSPMLSPNMYSPQGVKLGLHEDQDFFNISNPSHILSDMKNEAGVNRFLGNLFLEMDFHKNITSKISLAIDYNRQTEKRFYPDYGLASNQNADRYAEGKTYNRFLIQGNAFVNYHKMFNYIHDLKFTAGLEYISNDQNYVYGKSINSAADYFTTLSKGKADSLASNDEQSILGSLFGKMDYALKDRYLLSANIRADGSSRFGVDSRYGLFYGASAGWRISAEPFLSDVHLINELKLKVGYGKSGNENIDDFAAYNLYGGADYNLRGATKPISLGNPDLKWETTDQLDVGIEFLGFNSRVGLEVDLYLKKTSDLFYVKELPSVTGYSGYLSNLGDMENKGIDVSLFSRIIDKQFRWDSRINIGAYQNEVTRLPEGDYSKKYDQFIGLAREGEALGVFLGHETLGLYDNENQITVQNGSGYLPFQPGDVHFEDRVPDGTIDDKDMTVIGNPHPDFFGGFINTLQYKQFSLDINISFSYGNEAINTTRSKLEAMSGNYNQTTAALRAWQNTGDASKTEVPRMAYGDPAGNARNSSRWVEDASYVKLNAATLSYQFDEDKLGKTVFKSVKLYLKGQNLYTLSKYLGYSPDFITGYNPLLYGIDMGAFPVPSTFFVGVKLGL